MKDLPIAGKDVDRLRTLCRHHNVFPIFLANYHPYDGKHPVGELLRDLVEECMGYLEVMSDEEVISLVEEMPPKLRQMLALDGRQKMDEHTRQRTAIYYLMGAIQDGYISYREALFPDMQDNAVFCIYPELASLADDDGMLVLDDRFTPMDAGILYKDHVLHYHQCLRRGFSSNPNFDFISRFFRYWRTASRCAFRIAVDYNRIMPKEFLQRICERDTWFGPSFQRDRLDDPAAVGVTILKRAKPSPFEMGDEELDRTEFFWSHQEGIKTFQVEEISTPNQRYGPYNLNRYVHAQRDIRAAMLKHFDGAVKVYLENEYAARLNSQMPNAPRGHAKVKLFRIDGDVDVDQWVELTSYFLKGNEMLMEYFDPAEFERRFGPRIRRCSEIKDSAAK